MTEHPETKILFAGPMGAGKTTAITVISDVPPVSTEMENSDRTTFDKESTTVALDFGMMHLPDGHSLRLYGTPGQERFRFMWDILAEGAMGVVILVNAAETNAASTLRTYLQAFRTLCRNRQAVIGVGRSDHPDAVPMRRLQTIVHEEELMLPMFTVDVRERTHVVLLLDTLLCQIESRVREGMH